MLSSRTIVSYVARCVFSKHALSGARVQSTSAGAEAAKTAILRASLQHIPKLGWSVNTLKAGARAVGLELNEDHFPGREWDLVEYFEKKCNADLVRHMQQMRTEDEASKSKSKFVETALEHRLRMLIPYMEQWPQAMALKVYPSATIPAMERLALMVDDIWYWAGDRSTDFNWYTKRALLAGIYTSTELHMVQDKSSDFRETWCFLDRRMDDVKTFAKYRGQMDAMLNSSCEIVNSSISTLKNAAGYNLWWR